MKTNGHPWAVVIFACRESPLQLRRTLEAALRSAAHCSVVHLLVNGNPTLADALAAELRLRQGALELPPASPDLKVWSIPLADKANAWNQYLHRLWAGEEITFFVDGYVRLNPDAVTLLGNVVAANAQALGGSGVPTMGRSAKAIRETMILNTGYHGNFCCIKGDTIGQMRAKQIRLPVGLYRTDSLMGAILSYSLDPSTHVWDDVRIQVHPTASWQIDAAKWWRMNDLQAFFRRRLRQARGELEKAAFSEHLAKRRRVPAELPDTTKELVSAWVTTCPEDYKRLARKHFLTAKALESFRTPRGMRPADLEPELVFSHESATTA
ncbi:hypothetical protein [Rhodoferax sp.]|uniref:hypothetical protein n=1 Tax=Rhodoferax sp. TaxID=50421 RepID=UPI00284BC82A|nr:hypothetical protein [Rhodoferax sp.]MDR3369912.1 hypothetical protein [Rhodoferax sp.]